MQYSKHCYLTSPVTSLASTKKAGEERFDNELSNVRLKLKLKSKVPSSAVGDSVESGGVIVVGTGVAVVVVVVVVVVVGPTVIIVGAAVVGAAVVGGPAVVRVSAVNAVCYKVCGIHEKLPSILF